MKKLLPLILSFGLIILPGCLEKGSPPEVVSKSVSSDHFVLKVNTPITVGTGETLKVKGEVKYTGNDTLLVTHGEPIVRFQFTGSDEERSYTDRAYTTEFKPDQVVKVEDEFKATKKGKHKLFVSAESDLLKIEPFEIEINVK